MNRRIFISYRRAEDQWAVGHLRERLCDEFGADHVFFDEQNIQAGEDWRQRLQTELEGAAAVVMVFGASWYGHAEQGRRIDDANDMVRFELVKAHELGIPIVPVVVDETPPPSEADLPVELRFLLERQFRRLHPSDSLDKQTDRLILDIRQVSFGRTLRRHYLMQAMWVAAVAVSVTWLARTADLLGAAEDAFARTAQLVQFALQPPMVPGFVVVEVDNNDYRELFGGRTPLDPEVMTIFADALLKASRSGGTCQPSKAIGINIELAPGESGANDPRFDDLARSLRMLATCRPVVLSCPQSVEAGETTASDQRWLALLTDKGGSPGQPPVLASTRLESTLLRHSRGRLELGAVVGDLAAGRPPATDSHAAAECACPWTEKAAGHCNRDASISAAAREAGEPDRHSLVVPFGAQRYTFAHAMLSLRDVSQADVFMVGGGFGTQTRFSVPFLPATRLAGATGAMAHTFVARSAREQSLDSRRLPRAAVDLAVALPTSAALMWLWSLIGTHPYRFSTRALGYLGVMMLFIGIPLACLGMAVFRPAYLSVAAGAVLVIQATCLRSAIAGYEVVLNNGVAWKSLSGLWQATVTERDRRSARIRLATACGELLLMLVAVAALLLSGKGMS